MKRKIKLNKSCHLTTPLATIVKARLNTTNKYLKNLTVLTLNAYGLFHNNKTQKVF